MRCENQKEPGIRKQESGNRNQEPGIRNQEMNLELALRWFPDLAVSKL